jgi:hypothetical protein
MAGFKNKTGKPGTSPGRDKGPADPGAAKKAPGKTAPAAKKPAAGGTVPKREKDREREALARELRGLIPLLDAEGLSFLIEQAQVHLYNTRVEELRRTLSRAKPGTPKQNPAGIFRIEGTESGGSYYLIYNHEWIMFSREEMIRITSIVSAGGTGLEIRDRLFTWFERERRDVLASIPMADKFDDKLKNLAALIKKTFRVRYR